MIAFAFFILLYLHDIVSPSPETYPLTDGNHSGLTRFAQITGWVRCCLYAEGSTSMYEVQQVHILPLYLLVKAYQQLSLFRMTTLETIYICSPYHPSQHLPIVVTGKVTLSRQLHTRKSLSTHVSVGSTDGTDG